MENPLNHFFTIKGFIRKGQPWITWEVSFVEAESIDAAIFSVREMFREKIIVTDVTRILTSSSGGSSRG